MNLAPLAIQKFFDNNGKPMNGGLLFTYVAGTTTKIASYTDETGGSLNTNPIVLDFRGECHLWLDPRLVYKFTLAPPGDTDPPTRPIWTVDNITSAISFGDLTQQIIGQILYPQTAAEIAAGVTPIYYYYPPGDVRRYGAIGDGVTNDTVAVQSAIDVAGVAGGQVFIPEFTYFCSNNLIVDGSGVYINGLGYASRLLFPAAKQLQITSNNCHLHEIRISGPDAGALSDREDDSVVIAIGASSASYISGLFIEACNIDNSRADGVLCRFVEDFRIALNNIQQTGYAGIGLESCRDGVVIGNRVSRVNEADDNVDAFGIQMTRNADADPVCQRIAVTGNTVDDIPKWTGIDTHCGEELTITGNICRNVTNGINATAGNSGIDSPNKITISGNQLRYLNATGAGAGIIISGGTDVPGSPLSYATDIAITGNVLIGFGAENDNAGGMIIQATRNITITGNVIFEPRRHGIVLTQDNLGFTITGNTVTDPNGTAGDSAFVRIVADYQSGLIGGNSLIRGELIATSVCEIFINRAASTYANSTIRFDYNYSEQSGIYYPAPDTANFEWDEMRRSDQLFATPTLTATGMTTSPTGVARIEFHNRIVVMFLPTITGTSNTTALTLTGLPAQLQPATQKVCICRIVDSATGSAYGLATIESAGGGSGGTITFGVGAGAGAFTNSGTKGVGRCEIAYSLN